MTERPELITVSQADLREVLAEAQAHLAYWGATSEACDTLAALVEEADRG